jgi:hypothetical protein
MNRKMVLAGLAAASVAASAAPAVAQSFSVGVGFGDYGYNGWYGDYDYYRPSPRISVGFGTPDWGYNDWSYGSYAAAPCTCTTGYRTTRVAPRYRTNAYGGYPYDDSYAYSYDDNYYGGTYASVGFGWSDDGWRGRGWRDRDRFSREDRVRVSNRDFRGGREFRDRGGREEMRIRSRDESRDRGGISRTSMRTSETRSMTRGGGEFRGSANAEFRGGSRGEISRSTARGAGNATVGTGGGGRRHSNDR